MTTIIEAQQTNDSVLSRIFAKAGRKQGFTEVTATWAPFTDFKVRWTRNYRWAEFEVSDYLGDAPVDVIESLANTVFARICGDRTPYPANVRAYLTNDAFVEKNRPVYLSRSEDISEDHRGECRNLLDSAYRLLDAGLIDRIPVLRWAPLDNMAVKSSMIMRTVIVNSRLDNDAYVSDEAMDYALYAGIARVQMGMNATGGNRAEEYDALLGRYPGRGRAEDELRMLRMHI